MTRHDMAFVRDTIVPERAPPVTESGVWKWMRENLFSSWFNAIVTALSVYVIYTVVTGFAPWFTNSVWQAGSLSECRDILEGARGACFAVITERWNQLMFGFYPSDLYWRPTLTAMLFLVAIAPVLFTELPRRMLWFSAVYPFLAYFLLWGGSVWIPVMAALGFVLGALAFLVMRRVSELLAPAAAILVPLVWWVVFAAPAAEDMSWIAPVELQFVRSDRFGGFLLSLVLGLTAISISLPMGVLLALGRQSDLLIVRMACIVFIEFIRGVPLITLLFTASLLLNYFLPPGTSFDLILRVIIMVTFFAAAYIAEVVRGGLASLPRGQYEAADALGLTYWQAQRKIIMPQALKVSIPGIVNTFIGLFKDTTLVVFIGLLDPVGLSNSIRSDTAWTGIYWELFVFIGAFFFVFCFGISRYSMYLERKLTRGHN